MLMVNQNDILDVPAGPATAADEALLDNLASGQVEELAVTPKEGQYVPVTPPISSPGAEAAPKQAVAVIAAPQDTQPTVSPLQAPAAEGEPFPTRMAPVAGGSFLHTLAGQTSLVILGAFAGVALYFALTRLGM